MNRQTYHELIDLRPITDDDLEFLCSLYTDTRLEEMEQTGWTEEQILDFLRYQFELQHQHYMKYFKGSQFDVVLYNKEPAGRLYVHRQDHDIRIIDIALFRKFRRQGIGSKLMNDLIAEAESKNTILSLHVEHNNPAMGLYERLGFKKGKISGVYTYMERPPAQKDQEATAA